MCNFNSVLNSMRTAMIGNVKKLSFALVIFFVPLSAFSATSVSQYGITWNFDKDYEVGTFVNGDYYVVDDGDGVTVVSVSPRSMGLWLTTRTPPLSITATVPSASASLMMATIFRFRGVTLPG